MDGTKITRQRDGRMESKMVGIQITRPKDGWHKNDSPKGWTDEELDGRHANNSPKDGWHKNDSPKGWTDEELDGRHANYSPKRWVAQK